MGVGEAAEISKPVTPTSKYSMFIVDQCIVYKKRPMCWSTFTVLSSPCLILSEMRFTSTCQKIALLPFSIKSESIELEASKNNL